ncbi:unnamed protein product [Lasius platythorax]
MNVTLKQKEILLNYLKNNANLARGRIDRKSESKRKMKDMWNSIAEKINAADIGPQKSGQEWAKTWKDIKSYILKKEAKRRNSIQGTGGGLPPKVNFSTFEEDVLEFLTPEAAGMDNIPEGGIIDDEPMLQECSSRSDVCSNNNVIEEQNMSYPEIEENDDIENVSPKSAPKVKKKQEK